MSVGAGPWVGRGGVLGRKGLGPVSVGAGSWVGRGGALGQ